MAPTLTVSLRAVPQLDAIGIVSSDLSRTRAFYALLGIEFAEGDDHVEATMPNGLRLMVDTEDVIRSFAPDWTRANGNELALAFACDSPAEVCGLGLPALAAALRGADVLATDWAEEAIELLHRNAERNGVFIRLVRVRWSEPEPLLRAAPWDLVLGADLLYEARNAEQLAELLPQLGGEVLLAEPGRPYAKEFLERFRAEPVGERIYRLA